jgi:hypothetical protein
MQEIETFGKGVDSVGESGGAGSGVRGQRVDQLSADSEVSHEQIDDLESALLKAVEKIAELEKQLADASTSHDLERQLVEAGVLDLETATVLAERRLAGTDASAGDVVAELVSSKPFLFRTRQRGPAGSAVSGGPADVRDSLSQLADEAMQSGDRRAVLRYLKRRRG